jgi:hypothetical protein
LGEGTSAGREIAPRILASIYYKLSSAREPKLTQVIADSEANNCITTQTSTTARILAHKPKLTQVMDDLGDINSIAASILTAPSNWLLLVSFLCK